MAQTSTCDFELFRFAKTFSFEVLGISARMKALYAPWESFLTSRAVVHAPFDPKLQSCN